MVPPRLQKGVSDPVSYQCTCEAKAEGGGIVLLFYRYFANNPPLPAGLRVDTAKIEELASWQREITATLSITGKIRVAIEGFNITVGGSRHAIEEYIQACTNHWSFSDLDLSGPLERKTFFKPSTGCACVFHPATEASVRVCEEITPLGITSYAPSSWDIVEELLPAEFHRRCHEESVELMDLRNHYESRIGYFVYPNTGEPALRPQIRRFSQWPRFFNARERVDVSANQVLTYCTGGIRCEKATRWMAEHDGSDAKNTRICTLKGGIAAYLDWMDEEIAKGRMTGDDSLFKGRNYVFDARGATSLNNAPLTRPVSQCHGCGGADDRLSKCRTQGCHLVLVVCEGCEEKDMRCCGNCRDQAKAELGMRKKREMCTCEQERELALWAREQPKPRKSQGAKR